MRTSAAKLGRQLRHKANLEDDITRLRGDLEQASAPDARAEIAVEIQTQINKYARLLRRLENER